MPDVKFYQTHKFMKLRRSWYNRLKKSGFRDVEYAGECSLNNDSPPLTGAGPALLRTRWDDSKAEYFRMAEHWLIDGQMDKSDTSIWRMHSEGLSHHKIARRAHTSRLAIANRIAKIRENMFTAYLCGRQPRDED
jgi:hypothetical protein